MGVPGPDPLSLSKGDFVDPCLGDLILVLKLPRWLKGLLAFLLKPLLPRLAAFLSGMKSR